jgi:hypothetical protein
MKRPSSAFVIAVLIGVLATGPAVDAYVFDTTVPSAGGCPQPDRWSPVPCESADAPVEHVIAACSADHCHGRAAQTGAQLDEIEQPIADSFVAWAGLTGTTFNATAYPGLIGPPRARQRTKRLLER